MRLSLLLRFYVFLWLSRLCTFAAYAHRAVFTRTHAVLIRFSDRSLDQCHTSLMRMRATDALRAIDSANHYVN